MKKRNKGFKNPNIKRGKQPYKTFEKQNKIFFANLEDMTHKSVATFICISVFLPD